jgi:hypothetical protein
MTQIVKLIKTVKKIIDRKNCQKVVKKLSKDVKKKLLKSLYLICKKLVKSWKKVGKKLLNYKVDKVLT